MTKSQRWPASASSQPSVKRTYLPDFIVQIDDGRPDLFNLVVEIKGFRGEDAKEKANTMRNYWVPGVNNLGSFGRWGFAEFTSVSANSIAQTNHIHGTRTYPIYG